MFHTITWGRNYSNSFWWNWLTNRSTRAGPWQLLLAHPPPLPPQRPPCGSSSTADTPAPDLCPRWSLCLGQIPEWLVHSPTLFRSLPRCLPLKQAVPNSHFKRASQPLPPDSLFFFTASWLFEIILCISVLSLSPMSTDFNCVIPYCIPSSKTVPS